MVMHKRAMQRGLIDMRYKFRRRVTGTGRLRGRLSTSCILTLNEMLNYYCVGAIDQIG